MSDDPIGREIRQLRDDFRDGIAEIKDRLSLLLPREVYDAHRDAQTRRIEELEREVERRETEIDNLGAEIKRLDERRQTGVFQRWSGIVLPLLTLAAFVVFQLVFRP